MCSFSPSAFGKMYLTPSYTIVNFLIRKRFGLKVILYPLVSKTKSFDEGKKLYKVIRYIYISVYCITGFVWLDLWDIYRKGSRNLFRYSCTLFDFIFSHYKINRQFTIINAKIHLFFLIVYFCFILFLRKLLLLLNIIFLLL